MKHGRVKDSDGWQYATGWTSQDWRAAPRPLLDCVRRRKWTVNYALDFHNQAMLRTHRWQRSWVVPDDVTLPALAVAAGQRHRLVDALAGTVRATLHRALARAVSQRET